jgi:hypothetical protein
MGRLGNSEASLCVTRTLSLSDRASPPTHRVVQMKKNPVPAQSSTATEPAMPSPVRAIDSPVCSAVSFVKPTAGRRRHRDFKINEPFKINKRREIPCRQFDHNVVFGIRRADFSTAAGNSALIAHTKSRPRVAAPLTARPTGKKEQQRTIKNSNEISSCDGRFTREGTPCHKRGFLDGNS